VPTLPEYFADTFLLQAFSHKHRAGHSLLLLRKANGDEAFFCHFLHGVLVTPTCSLRGASLAG
jgi:hypothetical protein